MAGSPKKRARRERAELENQGYKDDEIVVKEGENYSVVVANGRLNRFAYHPVEIDAKNPHERKIAFALRIAKMPRVDATDTKAITERAEWYFSVCAQNGIRPSITGLAAAFGLSYQRLTEIRAGNYRLLPNWPRESLEIMASYIRAMETLWSEEMTSGEVNPIVSFFMGKNYYGMRDQTEHIIRPAEPLQAPAELQKLAESLPDE